MVVVLEVIRAICAVLFLLISAISLSVHMDANKIHHKIEGIPESFTQSAKPYLLELRLQYTEKLENVATAAYLLSVVLMCIIVWAK